MVIIVCVHVHPWGVGVGEGHLPDSPGLLNEQKSMKLFLKIKQAMITLLSL